MSVGLRFNYSSAHSLITQLPGAQTSYIIQYNTHAVQHIHHSTEADRDPKNGV